VIWKRHELEEAAEFAAAEDQIRNRIGKHITFTESREHCFGMGGLQMEGKKIMFNVDDLTLRESKGDGARGNLSRGLVF
jgi:hypothetical protein